MDVVWRVEYEHGEGPYIGSWGGGCIAYDLGAGAHEPETFRPTPSDSDVDFYQDYVYAFSSMEKLLHWFSNVPCRMSGYYTIWHIVEIGCNPITLDEFQVVYPKHGEVYSKILDTFTVQEYCDTYADMLQQRQSNPYEYCLTGV